MRNHQPDSDEISFTYASPVGRSVIVSRETPTNLQWNDQIADEGPDYVRDKRKNA